MELLSEFFGTQDTDKDVAILSFKKVDLFII